MHAATNESAPFRLQHFEHALDHVGLEQHIVVEKQHVWGARLIEEKLPLLCHSARRDVSQQNAVASLRAQHARDRLHFASGECIGIAGLVRHHDTEVAVSLSDQARESCSERRGPVARGDEHIDGCVRHRQLLIS